MTNMPGIAEDDAMVAEAHGIDTDAALNPEVKQRESYPFATIEVGDTFAGKKGSVAALCTRYNRKLAPKKFCTETKDGVTVVKRVA